MTPAKYNDESLDRSETPKQQDITEDELPSSSQFYQFYDPFIENEINTRFSNSDRHGNDDIRYLPSKTNQIRVSGMYENQRNERRKQASRTKGTSSDPEIKSLADDYVRILAEAVDNENMIKKKQILLDMQDKELEAIIANIAQLCDLNVTLMGDIRKAKNKRDYLKEKARECRIERLSKETGAVMLAAENKDLKAEIEQLQKEVDEAKEKNTNRNITLDKSLKDELASFNAQIEIQQEGNEELEEKVESLKEDYGCVQSKISLCHDDGEPCSGQLDKLFDYPSNAEIVGESSNEVHVYELSLGKGLYANDKQLSLSPPPKQTLTETSSVLATPSSECIAHHLNSLEEMPSSFVRSVTELPCNDNQDEIPLQIFTSDETTGFQVLTDKQTSLEHEQVNN